ncbi:hypothetical protein CERSUDRAFT_119845 [Gelatoporia subvermispora B]|uniref:very-long-chain enoyl-CoA reductase n=1 Tax=Ceriporiopsis subvermispora (strain B) TaxID=914234 RepID=M2QZC1_CERS8|nr:hypothetical protein CERSUDRAFT_119845 [Gelatoporia subvermispora B]
MVTVTVSAAGRVSFARDLPTKVSLEGKTLEDATIADVKAAIAAKYPKLYPARQKIALQGDRKALGDETTLRDAGITDGSELTVKDLGPQISWRTVFLVEYGGPLVIHPLIYHFPEVFYGGPVKHSLLQKYVYALVMLHFAKRELETVYVHRFSHGTMPLRNIFKNSAHYHLFSGLFLAYAVYSPTYSARSLYLLGSPRSDPKFLLACSALWLFAEISNGITHWTLRNLRPEGTKKRAIPYGYGFSLVSCPNYFFEVLAWVAVAAMTGSYVAWFFVALSTYQMAAWALKKHRNYKKEFGGQYPRGRKAMIPFIL